jgi:hypothetical protein
MPGSNVPFCEPVVLIEDFLDFPQFFPAMGRYLKLGYNRCFPNLSHAIHQSYYHLMLYVCTLKLLGYSLTF